MTDKARILFVDDEKRVLNAMRGLFRRKYDLFLTCEGAEAVRIADARHPLLDDPIRHFERFSSKLLVNALRRSIPDAAHYQGTCPLRVM